MCGFGNFFCGSMFVIVYGEFDFIVFYYGSFFYGIGGDIVVVD